MTRLRGSHPILSTEQARAFEERLFGGEEAREWPAMQRAGRAIAQAVRRDFEEIGGFPSTGRLLVLAGKGHNGGDALLAAQALLEHFPVAQAEVVFACGERSLRPLARRAWRTLVQSGGPRVRSLRREACGVAPAHDHGVHAHHPGGEVCGDPVCAHGDGDSGAAADYALCLDGVFGFQFRPPVSPEIAALFARVQRLGITLRAAVDLPSGLSENTKAADPVLRADFTYATGTVKAPVVNGLHGQSVGRLRYLDLGFFASHNVETRLRVLTPAVLRPLQRLRAPDSDKRDYGHLFVLGGSRSFPGAVLMTVLSALRSGAGLVTAFVPESFVAGFAARAPEAMWVGWPETPDGGLALEGQHLLRSRVERASALVAGPGVARDPETMALLKDIVATSTVPLVLDADALQPDIVRAGTARRILTPHLGELRRILEGDDFYTTRAGRDAAVVVKGRITGITTGGGREGYYSTFGGPVLARGGSGDLLAGIAGTMLAQTPDDPVLAAARAVVWQGLAADRLARAEGQVAVSATHLLDHLAPALREAGGSEIS